MEPAGRGPWTARAVQYAVAAVVFLVLDLLWLGTLAKPLYDDQLGELLRDPPNVGAAVAFYALFVAGLVFFVIEPAVRAGSWRRAVGTGAFFGLVTYATWDLTSLAVLEGFPALLVPVDLAWGAFLSAAVSATTWAVVRVLPDWAR
jgi:uncharacterized membrane protein